MQSYKIINVAAGKSAKIGSQSRWSTLHDHTDVLKDTKREFSFHTSGDDFPYLEIDLQDSYRIENIKLFNRKCGYQYLARTVTVEASRDGSNWALLHSGLVYWSDCFEIPCSGMVQARFIRLRLAEKVFFHLHHVEVNARIYTKFGSPVFVGRRTDGLGERLNALINAIRLSEIFQTDFKFSWSNRLTDDELHAIMPIHRMFSQDFIEKHHVPVEETRGAWEFDKPKRPLSAVEWTLCTHGGVSGPRTALSDHISDAAEILRGVSPAEAFKKIEFSPEINEAIALARATPLPDGAVAVHLRSGDVFYSDYRKYLHYTYKGLTIPIAKAMIRKFVDDGHAVYLFGQDREQIEYLAETGPAVSSFKLNADKIASLERHQKAMYDLVLLSRFEKILSGSSGFARQASWVGGSRIISPHEIFNAERQHEISIQDLEENCNKYNPLQTSFGYWYSYFYGRQKHEPSTCIDVVKKAILYDPDNELYHFVLSCLVAKNDDFSESARVLEMLFHDRRATETISEIFRVFTAKTLNAYNLAEYFPHVERAALSGSFFHSALMAELSFSKGDKASALSYVEQCTTGIPSQGNDRTHHDVLSYLHDKMHDAAV